MMNIVWPSPTGGVMLAASARVSRLAGVTGTRLTRLATAGLVATRLASAGSGGKTEAFQPWLFAKPFSRR